jgi:hypothetical protein
MGTMFFGQYLLAKGAINREALLDALERQRRSNLSLPDLAIQEGLIDLKQASAIMAQYRMSDIPIEVILAKIGDLSGDEIERLQHQQRSSWLRIGAALVEGGHMSDAEVLGHLDDYHSLETAANQQIREAMHYVPNSDAVGACVELTVFHFTRVSGRPAKLDSVLVVTDELEPGRQRFSQRIVGDGDYTVALDLPSELVAALARGLLGADVEPGTEAEADAVCEVVNLIGGNTCTRLEQLGRLLRPEPPVLSGPNRLVAPSDSVVRATVVSTDVNFDIRIFSTGGGAQR